MIRTRRVLLASMLVAAAVSLGYALAAIPNVELMTVTVFLAGFLLGPGLGTAVGAASMGLHSMFNPLGAAMPPLLIGQVLSFAVIGACGGVLGPAICRVRRRWLAAAIAGLTGFGLTLMYDVMTGVGAFYSISGSNAPDSLIKFIIAGVAFTVMHLVWNAGLFLLVLRPVLVVLSRYRDELR